MHKKIPTNNTFWIFNFLHALTKKMEKAERFFRISFLKFRKTSDFFTFFKNTSNNLAWNGFPRNQKFRVNFWNKARTKDPQTQFHASNSYFARIHRFEYVFCVSASSNSLLGSRQVSHRTRTSTEQDHFENNKSRTGSTQDHFRNKDPQNSSLEVPFSSLVESFLQKERQLKWKPRSFKETTFSNSPKLIQKMITRY